LLYMLKLCKRLFVLFAILFIPAAIALFFYIQSLNEIITQKFSGPKWDIPSRIYSDSLQIYPGVNLAAIRFKAKLDRLGYREVSDQVERQGEYQVRPLPQQNKAMWTIYLNDFAYPLESFKGQIVVFEVSDNVVLQIEENPIFEIEPELITEFFENAREQRQIVKLEKVPTILLNAIISVEDQRFLSHAGIDPRGIIRAFFMNLRPGRLLQGGSTITQQLVKNFFLTSKQSYVRKINEALMALIVESKHSKDEILEAYINEVYFGQRGSASIHGVVEASRFYFSKPLLSLTIAECAMLAGILRGPGIYNPLRHKKRAIDRRNFVLEQMLATKTILKSEYRKALREPLRPRNIASSTNLAPYFVDHVRHELLQKYSAKALNTQGMSIFTTLDIALQQFAKQAVTQTLKELEKRYASLNPEESPTPLQGAFVAVQPQTGYIRALVGGRNYSESQFNRITQAKRQPGSLFKPLVLLTALSLNKGKKFKLTDHFSDEPFTWRYEGGQVWEPKNYEDKPFGKVSLRQAIVKSINIPMAKLAREVGIKKIVRMAKKVGITSKLPTVPSISLGSAEVSPLEIASFYSVLANGGVKAVPIAVKHVVDQSGKILDSKTVEIKKAVSEEASFLVTYALQGAINNGTGRGVRLFGYTRPAAGKTGTTNDFMDAWFAGYTTDMVGVAWVGYDKNKPVGLSGAFAALPIWARFMIPASKGKPVSAFLTPENIEFINIDPESGFLKTTACPDTLHEAFVVGTAPKKTCPLHVPSTKKEK